MKSVFTTILLTVFLVGLHAQQSTPDSLRAALANAPDGYPRFKVLRDLYSYFEELNKDSALHYADLSIKIAQMKHQKVPEAYSLTSKAYQLTQLGRFADALQCLQQAFLIEEDQTTGKGENWTLTSFNFQGNNLLLSASYSHHIFALLMLRTGNSEQQILHFREAARIGAEINYLPRIILANMNLGQSYLGINRLDSALFYENKAASFQSQSGFRKYYCNIEMLIGDIYLRQEHQRLALQYYYAGLASAIEEMNRGVQSRIYLRLTKYHLATGNSDSALFYAKNNLELIRKLGPVVGSETNIGAGYQYLSEGYKASGQFDSAFKYQGLALAANDSLNQIRITNLTAFQNLSFSEQLRLKEVEKDKTAYQNKIRTWLLLSGIAVLMLFALIIVRNNREKHRSNQVLHATLANLKATQSQLIHSEKMASLGELTAGIAHEIQNPLNFVNNFSELSAELLDEMAQEISKGNFEEAKAIANDVKQNLEKINHHGKRADAIVKGMLQHSRTSSNQKELVDINALADEYLRLSYHGLRAKDKTFNAKFETSYDDTIGKVSMVPQDMGRVILNLINNAFYAVAQKKKTAGEAYEPTVSVSTNKLGKKVEIRVKDNGNGIPSKVVDKIFQPFFTTKPTGEGTGLGLSLAYDIVTKGHRGELRVETKEGAGSEFIIQLALSELS